MGLDAPGPGNAVFHTTFSFALHSKGRPFASEVPEPFGPRNRGQSSPDVLGGGLLAKARI